MINIKEATDFIVYGCGVSRNQLDTAGDYCGKSGWRTNSTNGPPSFKKSFIPPIGWTAIGLYVLNRFDNGNNDWLGTNNSAGEWIIGYHGVKSSSAVSGICNLGFISGSGQSCQNDTNSNYLTYYNYSTCGKGTYFAQDINDAYSYTSPIKYDGNNYRVIFMCRLNPYKIRIKDRGKDKDYMIANSQDTNEVRPYRILVKKDPNYDGYPVYNILTKY